VKQFDVTVYFDGPRCAWSQRLDDTEVIFRGSVPWLWLARNIANSKLGNTGRCAYAISVNGESIEERRATTHYVAQQ
jgi:hypothetical protein